jgi:hypothetical protein
MGPEGAADPSNNLRVTGGTMEKREQLEPIANLRSMKDLVHPLSIKILRGALDTAGTKAESTS